MPKSFSRQSKKLIFNLINYFEAERDNGGPAAVREVRYLQSSFNNFNCTDS